MSSALQSEPPSLEKAPREPRPSPDAASQEPGPPQPLPKRKFTLGASRFLASRDTYGNLSLGFLFSSWLIYTFWCFEFDYPGSARAVLWGFWSIKVAYWTTVINTLGGWLSFSAIISLGEPGQLFKNFLHPLAAIEERIRWVFRLFVTLSVSGMIFFLTLGIVWFNISIDLAAENELLIHLPRGHGSALLLQDGTIRDTVRLGSTEGRVRLLLRGPFAREILLLRDRYNLVTLEALEVRRSLISFDCRPLSLLIAGQPVVANHEFSARQHRDSPFALLFRGHHLYGSRGVLWSIVTERGTLVPGKVLVGEPEDAPEEPAEASDEVILFFKDLWEEREEFASWPAVHQSHRDVSGLSIFHPLSQYSNRILFRLGTISWNSGEGTAESKEAVLVTSRKASASLPATGDVLEVVLMRKPLLKQGVLGLSTRSGN